MITLLDDEQLIIVNITNQAGSTAIIVNVTDKAGSTARV